MNHRSRRRPSHDFQSYGETNRFVALTLGEELNHKLGKSTVLTQNFYFYPEPAGHRPVPWTFNLGTVTKISKWLGWQNQFGDILCHQPADRRKKNDLVFTTGLNFAFAH